MALRYTHQSGCVEIKCMGNVVPECSNLSERIPQPDKYRRSFIPEADVDPSDDIWPYHGPEAYAGVELKGIRTRIEEIIHDGAQVNERGNLPVSVHVEYRPAEQPDPLLEVE